MNTVVPPVLTSIFGEIYSEVMASPIEKTCFWRGYSKNNNGWMVAVRFILKTSYELYPSYFEDYYYSVTIMNTEKYVLNLNLHLKMKDRWKKLVIGQNPSKKKTIANIASLI